LGEGGVVRLVWDGARSNLRSERFIRKREQISALDTYGRMTITVWELVLGLWSLEGVLSPLSR